MQSLKKLCLLSMDNCHELIHQLWAGTIVFAALFSYCATVLVSIQSASDKAQWNVEETFSLLDCLIANKFEGDGSGNFKDSTYSKAVTAVAPFLSAGPQKTVQHCKTRWSYVCGFFSIVVATCITK